MNSNFCFLILILAQSSHSEPDTHVHVYLPPKTGWKVCVLNFFCNITITWGGLSHDTIGWFYQNLIILYFHMVHFPMLLENRSMKTLFKELKWGTIIKEGLAILLNLLNLWIGLKSYIHINWFTNYNCQNLDFWDFSKGLKWRIKVHMCFRKEKRERIIDASKIVDPNNKWECGKAPMG